MLVGHALPGAGIAVLEGEAFGVGAVAEDGGVAALLDRPEDVARRTTPSSIGTGTSQSMRMPSRTSERTNPPAGSTRAACDRAPFRACTCSSLARRFLSGGQRTSRKLWFAASQRKSNRARFDQNSVMQAMPAPDAEFGGPGGGVSGNPRIGGGASARPRVAVPTHPHSPCVVGRSAGPTRQGLREAMSSMISSWICWISASRSHCRLIRWSSFSCRCRISNSALRFTR